MTKVFVNVHNDSRRSLFYQRYFLNQSGGKTLIIVVHISQMTYITDAFMQTLNMSDCVRVNVDNFLETHFKFKAGPLRKIIMGHMFYVLTGTIKYFVDIYSL